MSRPEKIFVDRRRRAEAEILVDALAAHGGGSVGRLALAYRHLLAKKTAPDRKHTCLMARGIPDPSTRWDELLEYLRNSLVVAVANTSSSDVQESTADRSASLCNRSIVAVATFLRVTAGRLDDAADDMVESGLLTPGELDEVETNTAEALQVSSFLLRHVEQGTWRQLIDEYQAEPTGTEHDNLHKLPRPLLDPWTPTNKPRVQLKAPTVSTEIHWPRKLEPLTISFTETERSLGRTSRARHSALPGAPWQAMSEVNELIERHNRCEQDTPRDSSASAHGWVFAYYSDPHLDHSPGLASLFGGSSSDLFVCEMKVTRPRHGASARWVQEPLMELVGELLATGSGAVWQRCAARTARTNFLDDQAKFVEDEPVDAFAVDYLSQIRSRYADTWRATREWLDRVVDNLAPTPVTMRRSQMMSALDKWLAYRLFGSGGSRGIAAGQDSDEWMTAFERWLSVGVVASGGVSAPTWGLRPAAEILGELTVADRAAVELDLGAAVRARPGREPNTPDGDHDRRELCSSGT